jgi:DNA-binding NtrC family response regulator
MEYSPDVVLLDMNFRKAFNDGKEGLYWLQYIKEYKSEIAVVLITAYANVDLAVESLKIGATDFVIKPWNNQKLLSTLLSALEIKRSRQTIQKLETVNRELSLQPQEVLLNFKAPAMLELMRLVTKAAPTDANILIGGQNGTGKEVLAKLIHQKSSLRDKPFIAVDLGAINHNLFESELFGHKKGAFTDAKDDRKGRFELADGGTLFLDEIGNIPLQLQAKLLSAIQTKKVTPLGSTQSIEVNCRIICATNAPLSQMVREGQFRQDLFFRINTIEVKIPPLQKRKEDIPDLALYFTELYNRKYQKSKKISPIALQKMLDYHWPGNIRELKHLIERSIILGDEDSIDPLAHQPSKSSGNTPPGTIVSLEEMEKKYIEEVLENFDRNISKTAKALAINRNTLYSKIQKYGL